MNDTVIENLLQRAPLPEPPDDLLSRLQSQIVLPESREVRERPNGRHHPLRRWFPALAFGLFFLTCVVILGVQTSLILELRRENASLRAAAADLETLQRSDSETARAGDPLAALERLRADHNDLVRLRAEVADLRRQADESARLRTENESLAAAIAQRNETIAETPEQKTQRESSECDINLRKIGLSIRVWAQDENGRYPTKAIDMTNELGFASILFCPSDSSKAGEVRNVRTMGWSAFRPETASYQFILSGEKDEAFPERIVGRCPIHGHILLADGGVVTNALASGRYREVTIDGRLNLIKIDPAIPIHFP